MTLALALTATAALVAIVGSIAAVSARSLMRAVAALAVLFIGIAGLFASLGAYYLAAAQLFLFVGGVVTLLALAFSSTATPVARGRPLATIGVALLGVFLALALLPAFGDTGVTVSATELASALFARYGPALEVALLIILSGVIAIGYLLEKEVRT